MPRTRPEAEETIKRAIRDARNLDPLITQAKLVETLAKKFNRPVDKDYVRKLTNKVMQQVWKEADYKSIEQRLSGIRETYRMARERLLQVLYWNPNSTEMNKPYAKEVVEAANAIVMLDIKLLEIELHAGLYQKNAETIKEELRYQPLPPELREQIVMTFERWGQIPARDVQDIVGPPLQLHASDTTTA